MKFVTEVELRDLYKKEPFNSYVLVESDKLTPAAYEFLTERKIKLIGEGGVKEKNVNKNKFHEKRSLPALVKEPKEGYILMDSGKIVEKKEESYTHIRGKTLVLKNHNTIKFRGKLDALEAYFINAIVEIQSSGYKALEYDLTQIFEYIKKIMRAEVLNEPLEFIDFKGWSAEDVREYSHYPDKYFGIKHIMPGPKYGKIVAILNMLRVKIREVEIAAIDAFYDEDSKTVEREDIVLALNRLSSLIYIITCQYISGEYKHGK